MTTVRVTGLSEAEREVDQGAVDALAGSLDGSLLLPDDEGYPEAIALWNGMITKRPALVIQAGSTADAARAVNFAREHDLELSIKGGGHNIAGLALSDGGLTLDMSHLQGRPGRCRRAVGEGGPRLHAGRRRSSDAGARPGDDARIRLGHRSRRPDRRRWLRLPHPAIRLDGGRPGRGPGGHRRWRDATCVAHAGRGPLLGAARRGRQFRRRDGVHVPAPRDRATGDRRDHRVAGRSRGGNPGGLPVGHCRCAARADARRAAAQRATGTVAARIGARQADDRHRRLSLRNLGPGGSRPRAASGARRPARRHRPGSRLRRAAVDARRDAAEGDALLLEVGVHLRAQR